MSLRDLLESGANVSVTVTLDDLRAIFNEAAKGGRIFGALRNRDQRPRTGPGECGRDRVKSISAYSLYGQYPE